MQSGSAFVPAEARGAADSMHFTLLLYLAHAYYIQGVNDKDTRSLLHAKLYVERVRRACASSE